MGEIHPYVKDYSGRRICDTIRNSKDLERHVDYIHFNPVKHGLVARVRDWPYSSFHRYVQRGLLSEDWAGAFDDSRTNFGER